MPRNIDEDDEESPFHRQQRYMKYAIIGVVSFVVLMIILFGTFYTIDAGDRGIILTFGKPNLEVMQPGLHVKIPIFQSLIVYSVRTQTIHFDNPLKTGAITPSEYDALSGASKDLQMVQTAVIVNYHINEKDVLNIYQQYGDQHTYQVNILEPIIRNTVKATTAHFNANDLVDNRSEVVKETTDVLDTQFISKSAVLDNFNIVNFAYSDQYSKAIEEKATAQQNALTEQNKLVAVQYQAQQRVAQAKGEADAIAIQVQAINQQGGQSYVNLQAISRWNGQLPVVMGGNSMPFIDMRTIGIGGAVGSTFVNYTNTNVTA